MAKPTLNVVNAQLSHLESKLNDLLRKEQKTYEALAALVNFLSNGKKLEPKAAKSFSAFKKEVIAAVAAFEIKCKPKSTHPEPKFNVKHYERAITSASDSSYRDMAIQAAGKDLNREALGELVLSLRRDCREINREIKNLAVELRHKQQADASASAYELLQRVVEPILDEEDPATALT